MSVLTTGPYNLAFDELIFARVKAFNVYGWSSVSPLNTSGIKIRRKPDQMAAVTIVSKKQTEISLSWTALTGAATGNSAILSYSLFWDNATGTTSIQVIDSLVTTHKVTGLIGGQNYKFKIRARNIYDYGIFSSEVTSLASDIPDQIGIATVSIVGTNVVVDWAAPNANNTPILKY